jgi:predicted acyltransferase
MTTVQQTRLLANPTARIAPQRLQSLDTLRGFDMFWITGGGQLVHTLTVATGWVWLKSIDQQLHHPEWHGFRAYDLIFPLFIFMAGVSTPFSMDSRLANGYSHSRLARKAIQRGLILVALGILYNNGFFKTEWAAMRYPSVLGRIGLAGMFAQLLYIYSPTRALYAWFTGILIGYWAFMTYFPVPGCGAGLLTIECNPASYFDQLILPGHLHKGIHDPEGLVSTLPAIATGLLGIFAGKFLRISPQQIPPFRKVLLLLAAGIACIGMALACNPFFPINKNIWTSSFVFLTGGLSFLLLSLFYGVIDVLNFRSWTFFFMVIGMNSIVIYMLKKFIDFSYTAEALFGGLLSFVSEPAQMVGAVVTYILIQWLFMWILHRNKLFLKI